MQFRYLFLFLLLAFCFNTAWADFSNSSASIHPLYLDANEPFIVDIRGEWPTDCHPGEQKPVISEYTGDTALIEFETIVEHVTCNDVVTPYRVLVDMSDVVGSLEGEFRFIDITVRFGGDELEVEVPWICIFICSPVPLPRDIKPEAGLYYSDGLEKQGLLLARQNQRMAAYPLVYDESGSSEWVFGPGGIVEDVFFSTLYELTGGQCLGCPPPDEQPELNEVGKLTLLMDSQGLVQMKVNDGLFMTYEQSEFGYGSRDVGGSPPDRVPDLSGRWAFTETSVHFGVPVPEPSGFMLPLVFDIVLESVGPDGGAPVVPGPTPPTYVTFSLWDIEGEQVAEMRCDYLDRDNVYVDEMSCDLNMPNLEDGDTPFTVEMLSVERMFMGYVGPVLGVGTGARGTAVRID